MKSFFFFFAIDCVDTEQKKNFPGSKLIEGQNCKALLSQGLSSFNEPLWELVKGWIPKPLSQRLNSLGLWQDPEICIEMKIACGCNFEKHRWDDISGFGAGAASCLQWVENEQEAFHSLCRVEVHLTLAKNWGAAGFISLHNTLD